MSKVVIEFLLDSLYYDEFHKEWILSIGRGWRVDRIVIPMFAVIGIVLQISNIFHGEWQLVFIGGFCVAVAAFEYIQSQRKKAKWMAHALALPWSG